MRRTLLALLIVVVLVASGSFAAAYWLRCRRACVPPAKPLPLALSLSAAQAASVAELEAEYQRRLEEICAEHCAARSALAVELGRPMPDEERAAEYCRQMCAAQSAAERLTLDHLLKVRALLTPEQQGRHADLIRKQFAGPCTMRTQPSGKDPSPATSGH